MPFFSPSHQQYEWKRICFGLKSNVILSFSSDTAAGGDGIGCCCNEYKFVVCVGFAFAFVCRTSRNIYKYIVFYSSRNSTKECYLYR